MNKIISLLLFLIITFSGCVNKQPLAFANDEIEFSMPAGWFVKETTQPAEGDEIIVVQKGKIIPKSSFIITVLKGERDLRAILNSYGKIMQEQEVGFFTVESNFEAITSSQFGSYETLSSKYKMKVIGVKSEGIIYVFHHSNKTIILFFQKNKGKEEVFKEGIRALKESLIVM